MSGTESDGAALPAADVLLCAVRGFGHSGDVLLSAANELASLHEQRVLSGMCGRLDLDHERARLVKEIDRDVHARVPVPLPDAPLHTEGVGAVVDRLAQLAAMAYRELASDGDRFELTCHRLCELAEGYRDLMTEVRSGARRLPMASVR